MDLKARQQYPADMVPQLPAPPMAFMQQLQQMQAAAQQQMQATAQQQLQAAQPQQAAADTDAGAAVTATANSSSAAAAADAIADAAADPQPGEKCSAAAPGRGGTHARPRSAGCASVGAAPVSASLLPSSMLLYGKYCVCPPANYTRSSCSAVKPRSFRPVTLTCRGCLAQAWLAGWSRCRPPRSSTSLRRTRSACRRPRR